LLIWYLIKKYHVGVVSKIIGTKRLANYLLNLILACRLKALRKYMTVILNEIS